MTTFRGQLSAASVPRYLGWRMTGQRKPVELRLRCGVRIEMRPRASMTGNHDYGVAYEIFVERQYRAPFEIDGRTVETVVDLGANVGYATLWFLAQWPSAHVIAFEPHPEHFDRLRRHVTLNGHAARAVLHEQAAGVTDARMWITDMGAASRLLADYGTGRLEIQVRDVFAALDDRRIDVLKMDIEGAEHAILADPRFAALGCRYILMEWHTTPEVPDARERCTSRLHELGFLVEHSPRDAERGILWARRNDQATTLSAVA